MPSSTHCTPGSTSALPAMLSAQPQCWTDGSSRFERPARLRVPTASALSGEADSPAPPLQCAIDNALCRCRQMSDKGSRGVVAHAADGAGGQGAHKASCASWLQKTQKSCNASDASSCSGLFLPVCLRLADPLGSRQAVRASSCPSSSACLSSWSEFRVSDSTPAHVKAASQVRCAVSELA
jgi:hypothetical protein